MIANVLTLGQNNGSSGVYTLTGGVLSTGLHSMLGVDGAATFAHSGGTHTTVSELNLGRGANGSGVYNLSGSGVVSAVSTSVGYEGGGTFTQSGKSEPLVLAPARPAH